MKEIIIIETNKPQKLKNFLDKEHFSYKVYQEPKQDQEQLKERLISAYKRIAKNKKLHSELTL
jgi:capsule polysaccharide export protein KpsC/LpsZ